MHSVSHLAQLRKHETWARLPGDSTQCGNLGPGESHTHIFWRKSSDATFRQSIPPIYIKPHPRVYTEHAKTTKSSPRAKLRRILSKFRRNRRRDSFSVRMVGCRPHSTSQTHQNTPDVFYANLNPKKKRCFRPGFRQIM